MPKPAKTQNKVQPRPYYRLLPNICKCRQCGQDFDKLSQEWAYKLPNGRGGKWYYCTYKCWRKAAKQNQKPLQGETLVTYCGVNNYENLG